jgi:intein/homing endonuclease
MKDGSYKNIMDISLDDKYDIQTKFGLGELVEIVDRKLADDEEVFQIETEDGAIVELTGNHIVPIYRNGCLIEVRVDELGDNDFLITF